MSDGQSETQRFDVKIVGETYRDGSSYPWRGGEYTAVVEAEYGTLALLEVLDAQGKYGRIVSEGGDTDWTSFDDEREITYSLTRGEQ